MGEVIDHPRNPRRRPVTHLTGCIFTQPPQLTPQEVARIESEVERIAAETMGPDLAIKILRPGDLAQLQRMRRIIDRMDAEDQARIPAPTGMLWPQRAVVDRDAWRRALELGARLADQRRSRAFVQWMPRRGVWANLARLCRRPSVLQRVFP